MHYSLLFTDLVDSTKLTQELGDEEMAELWAAHDRIARDLLAPHRGREITKTDGFLILFHEPEEALRYALAYHEGLRSLNVEARAGLHVGQVVIAENSPDDVAKGAPLLEVEGVAKTIAERIMSIALGGQTLLTKEARIALEESGLRIESHGIWRMKGVAEPVEVFEVGDDTTSFRLPPDGETIYRLVLSEGLLLPVKEVQHNLRNEGDAFIGRDTELRALASLLEEGASPVTVLGIGGTGKTRLVTRYGWTHLGDWPGGVWFCDLSEVRDRGGMISAVARALDVPLGKEEPLLQLGHAIAGRGKCLVILDNFEQLTCFAEESLGVWLDQASKASFLITTREVLGLPGETTMELSPLDTDQGVILFSVRARQAKQDFSLTSGDRSAIESLVTMLDGLPLAIELAAARTATMPPKEMLSRMSNRFELISSSVAGSKRQSTLRGALDWSWNLLSTDERAALTQLSIFEGGFTLDAAETVLSLEEAWPTDAVQALVDKSLVRRISAERFSLLVSVQEYAAEKLDESGARDDIESRHGEYYARYGSDEAIDALMVHGGIRLRQGLSADIDNLITACRRAISREDGETALGALCALWESLLLRGPFGLATDLAGSLLKLSTLAPISRAKAALVLGKALYELGRCDEALENYEEALEHAVERGDRRLECILLGAMGSACLVLSRYQEAREYYSAALEVQRDTGYRLFDGVVLGNLGIFHHDQGRYEEAQRHYEEALARHRELGNERLEGLVLGNLGNLHFSQGRYDEALECYQNALAMHRAGSDPNIEGIVRGNLGFLHTEMGRYDEARKHYEKALVIHRRTGKRRIEGMVIGNMGFLQQRLGQWDSARASYEAALRIHREVGNRRFEGIVLGDLGCLGQLQGRQDEAETHFRASLAIHRDVGNLRSEGMVLGHLSNLFTELKQFEEARSSFESGESLLRDLGDPLQLGVLLCGRARLERAQGRIDDARLCLSEAEEIAGRCEITAESELEREIAKTRIELEGRWTD